MVKCLEVKRVQRIAINNLGKYGVITDSDNLIYIRARYYSPDLGRFTQTDIIRGGITNPISLNRYRYTNGNPINFADLNGFITIDSNSQAVYHYLLEMVKQLIQVYNTQNAIKNHSDQSKKTEQNYIRINILVKGKENMV